MRLSGSDLGIIALPSPNQRDRPAPSAIDTLILHYTGMESGEAAIERLRDPEAGVSSHYVVEEDGRIFQLVEEHRRAAHAGTSFWRGREMLNDSSIGIEIVNPGHEWGYRLFPAIQIEAVRRLCRAILFRHPIPPDRVLGHSDVAPDRKQDPGELFPWEGLARNGIGIWPDGVADLGNGDPALDGAELAPVRHALRRIGYAADETGGMDDELAVVLRAFQRHWRPEAVTGLADRGTRARLFAVMEFVRR
jgi:N-acetylmuramoyl-L-alanine amidase